MKTIPRKDRAFGVWHTSKQKGTKRQHKGSGGGRRKQRTAETSSKRRGDDNKNT